MNKKFATRLSGGRSEHHRFLVSFPNTIGTAIGFKRRSGVKTQTPAIIVYVREKVPIISLDAATRIPPTLVYDGKPITTDVYILGRLQYQFGSPPWFCRDRVDNQGTVTTLCRTATGEVFGLTCAHCIGGVDCDPSTPGNIELWDAVRMDYLPIGMSGAYANTTGLGLPGNFGFSDWGLFSVEDQELSNLARSASTLAMGSTEQGTPVTTLTAHGLVRGVVEHSEIQLPNLFADVSIHVEEGAMFPGDSGALWCDSNGRAVAIHAIGLRRPIGSPMSFAMFATRVASDLRTAGIELLAM